MFKRDQVIKALHKYYVCLNFSMKLLREKLYLKSKVMQDKLEDLTEVELVVDFLSRKDRPYCSANSLLLAS